MTDTLPIIDLRRWTEGSLGERVAVAFAVDQALRRFGFLLLTGHGVPTELVSATRDGGRQFFGLPTDVKAAYATTVGGYGWIPPGAEANSYASGKASPPDLKETLATRLPAGEIATWNQKQATMPWPVELPELEATLTTYLRCMQDLAMQLLELFACGMGLDDDALTRWARPPSASMNINHYPSLRATGEPAPGQFRIGPHTDFGVVTILDRQPGYGGLQIQLLNGEWIDAPYVADAFTINIGDLLARWTGDRWRSTPHQVLPPSSHDADEDLCSLVYFFSANPEARIETLPVGGPRVYEPIVAQEYIKSRLALIDVA
jgi:isopenicillin N synthase-like dioxygenase